MKIHLKMVENKHTFPITRHMKGAHGTGTVLCLLHYHPRPPKNKTPIKGTVRIKYTQLNLRIGQNQALHYRVWRMSQTIEYVNQVNRSL